jgi:hypothetical protein
MSGWGCLVSPHGPRASEGTNKVARALCSTDVSSVKACLNLRQADLLKRRHELRSSPGMKMTAIARMRAGRPFAASAPSLRRLHGRHPRPLGPRSGSSVAARRSKGEVGAGCVVPARPTTNNPQPSRSATLHFRSRGRRTWHGRPVRIAKVARASRPWFAGPSRPSNDVRSGSTPSAPSAQRKRERLPRRARRPFAIITSRPCESRSFRTYRRTSEHPEIPQVGVADLLRQPLQ